MGGKLRDISHMPFTPLFTSRARPHLHICSRPKKKDKRKQGSPRNFRKRKPTREPHINAAPRDTFDNNLPDPGPHFNMQPFTEMLSHACHIVLIHKQRHALHAGARRDLTFSDNILHGVLLAAGICTALCNTGGISPLDNKSHTLLSSDHQ